MLTRFINYKLLIFSNLFIACLFYSVITGCDKLVVAADRQRHEDQEYPSPRAHCKCNDQGNCVFLHLYICVCAHSCNDPGPGHGVVQALLGGDGGQEPRGQRRGTLRGVG